MAAGFTRLPGPVRVLLVPDEKEPVGRTGSTNFLAVTAWRY
jgi:hypothetical protein